MDSESIRKKWDERYRNQISVSGNVSDVLKQNEHHLPRHGTALDIASGLGANALYLAERGLDVHAWDISPVAIEKINAAAHDKSLMVRASIRDVIDQPPEVESFEVIVVSRFLERKLCPAITAALKPGGLLFYQTYSRDNRTSEGPSNPDFLLERGELPELFNELEVVLYQEGDEAQFIGRKR